GARRRAGEQSSPTCAARGRQASPGRSAGRHRARGRATAGGPLVRRTRATSRGTAPATRGGDRAVQALRGLPPGGGAGGARGRYGRQSAAPVPALGGGD